jgi:mRNA interferase MazF
MFDEFDIWNSHKKRVHSKGKRIYFCEGDIRWVYLGKNVGTEIIGKGAVFFRPVLILKKVFGHSAIVLPLSTQIKTGSYYYECISQKGIIHYANLAQVKYLDGKRIRSKIDSFKLQDLDRLKLRLFSIIQ